MKPRGFDAIVVGVGAMGAAACWRLARRGARVLGLERFRVGHEAGSSGGATRMIRLAYFEHPDYVPLLLRAYELWDDLDRSTGSRVLHRTGALYAGPREGELVTGSARSATEHGLPHEPLDAATLTARHPAFRFPADHAAVHEPEGGLLLTEPAIRGMVAEARRHGAEIREEESVLEWSADESGAWVTTARGRVRAERVVWTAGPWTGALVGELSGLLSVTRQVVGWVEPPDSAAFAYGEGPCWAIEHEGGLLYGFPILPGETTMKVAYHHRGRPADPEFLDREPGASDEDELRDLLDRYLPSAGPIRRLQVCMYTYSPDGHFIVDRHPAHDRALVACGFSGHGFKFAPVIGEALTDLALEGRTGLPMGFLGLDRFGAGVRS